MLDKLPYEVVLKVCSELDPYEWNRRYPDYIFRPYPNFLRPLAQVSPSYRSLFLPLMIKEKSLLRNYEIERTPVNKIENRFHHNIQQLFGYEQFVTQLELHSTTIDLIKFEDFQNVKSLTVLGPLTNSSAINEVILNLSRLDHLALFLADGVHLKLKSSIKRLDLLLESEQSLDHLEVKEGSKLKELHITSKGFSTIMISAPLSKFLKLLEYLNVLSIRRKGSITSHPKIHHGPSRITSFFDAIRHLPLTTLEIDRSLLSYLPVMSSSTNYSTATSLQELSLTLVEKSLAGPFTVEQNNDLFQFLLSLSKIYMIKSLKLVYGLQTELPSNIALYILKVLFEDIYQRSNIQYENLQTIKSFSTIMAWNIREDTLLSEKQRKYPFSILSYEVNYDYTPTYKRLIKYKVVRNNERFEFVKDHSTEENDFGFWSSEVIGNDLLRLTDQPKRSSIWD